MKRPSLLFLRALALASLLAGGLAARAQEPAPASPPRETPAAPAAPAVSTDSPTRDVPPPVAVPAPGEPAVPPPSVSDAAASAPAAPPAPAPEKKSSELRRLDIEAPGAPAPSSKPVSVTRSRPSARDGGGDRVVIADDVVIGAGEKANDVVAILGSATAEGDVVNSLVAVIGDAHAQAAVGEDVVAVLGSAKVDGRVGGEVVAVFGNVELGPRAEVHGDVVSVGGRVKREPGSVVHGTIQTVPVGAPFGGIVWLRDWITQCALKFRLLAFGPGLAWAWGIAFAFLGFYVLLALLFRGGMEKCVTTLETRPGYSVLAAMLTVLLAPIAIVLLCVTVVGVAAVPFVAAGLFFAGLFGKAVLLAWIGKRFTRAFGGGPLSHIAVSVLIGGVIVMLFYTVWGSILLYKLLSWLGLGVVVYTIVLGTKREKAVPAPAGGRGPGGGAPMPAPMPPSAPVAPGAAGAARSAFAATPGPSVAGPAVAESAAAAPATPPLTSAGFVGAGGASGAPAPAAAVPPPANGLPATPDSGGLPPVPPLPPQPAIEPMFAAAPPPPPPPAAYVPPPHAVPPRPAPLPPSVAATLPRATLWQRLAALALDVILVAVVLSFLNEMIPRTLRFNFMPSGLLVMLAIYGAAMWKEKGTTIGGIICGLKVVRLDGREIDWGTAAVRALGCFLSLVVAGLGFIWIAFDEERQSWHDKIAGTIVVRLPKSVPLV